jgi:hypothetical protein
MGHRQRNEKRRSADQGRIPIVAVPLEITSGDVELLLAGA